MRENYDNLIEILEASVHKNGEKPLSNKWLLNALKIATQKVEQKDNAVDCGVEKELLIPVNCDHEDYTPFYGGEGEFMFKKCDTCGEEFD